MTTLKIIAAVVLIAVLQALAERRVAAEKPCIPQQEEKVTSPIQVTAYTPPSCPDENDFDSGYATAIRLWIYNVNGRFPQTYADVDRCMARLQNINNPCYHVAVKHWLDWYRGQITERQKTEEFLKDNPLPE